MIGNTCLSVAHGQEGKQVEKRRRVPSNNEARERTRGCLLCHVQSVPGPHWPPSLQTGFYLPAWDEGGREGDRERDRQTDRQAGRQRHSAPFFFKHNVH